MSLHLLGRGPGHMVRSGSFFPSAVAALDFISQQYRVGPGGYSVNDPSTLPGWSFTRASSKTALTSSGAVVSFGSGVPAITDLGLLVEEARTNLVLWSQDFTNAAWTKSAVSVSGTTAAPDGTSTGQKIVEDSTNANHQVIATAAAKATSALTYSYTVFAKAGERSKIVLWLTGASTANRAEALYDLSSATASQASAAGAFTSVTAAITSAANGWYRCVLVATSDTSVSVQGRVFLNDGAATADVPAYQGNGASGGYIWGAQLEQASFATSYIPTTSAAVTRAADNAVVTGLTAPSQGTVQVYAMLPSLSGTQGLFSVNDGTSANRIDMRASGTGVVSFGSTGGVAQWSALAPTSGTPTAGAPFHAALSFIVNQTLITFNGQNPGTKTGATIGTGMTQLRIGDVDGGNAALANGYIQRLSLYPTANNPVLTQ